MGSGYSTTEKAMPVEKAKPWGTLISMCYPETSHRLLKVPKYYIGQDIFKCDLWLNDPSISERLCKIWPEKGEGDSQTVYLRIKGKKGRVYLNGKVQPKHTPIPLNRGDELVFGDGGWQKYIFLLLPATETWTSTKRQTFKDRFQNGIVNPKDMDDVSFEDFPYYLSETTKNVLISSTYIHLRHNSYARFVGDLTTLSSKVLLSGPVGSEIYQETLTKALARHYGAKLLVIDSLLLPHEASTASSKRSTFKKGDRVKFVGIVHPGFPQNQNQLVPIRGPTYGYEGKVVLVFEENASSKIGVRFDKKIPGSNGLGGLCEIDRGYFCVASDLLPFDAMNELFEVAVNEAKGSTLVVFLKDIEISMACSANAYAAALKAKLDNLPENIVVIVSHIQADNYKNEKVDFSTSIFYTALLDLAFPDILNDKSKKTPKVINQLGRLFPNKIVIQMPQDRNLLLDLKRQLNLDIENLKSQANLASVKQALTQIGFQCPDLETVCIKDIQSLTTESAEKVVGWALSHHIMHASATEVITEDSKLLISSESIYYGLDVLQSNQNETKILKKSLKEVFTENEFEKKLLSEVIPPNEIGVSFDDIGALENVKNTLKELVILPLQRPELFTKGHLTKPCKGILLFGPPGTGKTMLAKAVATEAGANFINISMSKWFGEGEKYVKAVFTLASKISPCIVFIDEVDRMLGRCEIRTQKNEEMRKMKNEFITNWDGLRTKDKEHERVFVLAVTNRPFDLDETVIKRFPLRLMVNLPDWTDREKIMRVVLGKEELSPNFDFEAVACMTEGYSGSDLKNLCVAAAHLPIREILEQEKKQKVSAIAGNMPQPALLRSEDIRPLCIEDFRIALTSEEVNTSVLWDSSNVMNELIQWNILYGEGGLRKKKKCIEG